MVEKIVIFLLNIYLGGEQCFLHNVVGSSISEYPALFTIQQNKMSSRFVSVTGEEIVSF